MEPLIAALGDLKPKIHSSAFIAPGAVIVGDVEIGEDVSIWYGCVLRGDSSSITIGKGSNVQDNTVIHQDSEAIGGTPTRIGEYALIGHQCMLHGAQVHDGGFVGMGATMLDHAVVESGAMLAAGAFLTRGKRVPTGELWAGAPAKKFRDMSEMESASIKLGVESYIQNGQRHRAALEER
ncbi:MAG: gamma carbonic anhydrase family protein [Pseudomonadota bacterium]